jgi:hypothetical protein
MQCIELAEERPARNSWETYALSQMKRLDGIRNQSTLSIELERKWKKSVNRKAEVKPASWLSEIEEQGWAPHKILGRTHLYKRASDGKILAIKWQKAHEDRIELFKEQTTLEVIRRNQERLGLQSEFPKPLGVYQFEGELPKGYFRNTTVETLAAGTGNDAVAFVYEFPNEDYFTYLNDPRELEDTITSRKDYYRARHALIADLFVLAKNGLIMTQLADIFHRSEESRAGRDDNGRYLTMNFLVRQGYSLCEEKPGDFTGAGNGRLHHLEKAVKYPNAGYNGMRDIGDSELLSDFENPEFYFNKKHFSKLMATEPGKATAYILANFLAEYLLVYELLITERRVNGKENQLDWKDSKKVEELANELKEGFVNAMRYYGGMSLSLSRKFIEKASIDWTRAAKQLHFFHRNDEKGYRPYYTPELMPKEIYGEDVEILPAWNKMFWPPEHGMTSGGHTRHRGTFSGTDPVKEPEKGRVILMTHMLLLEKAKKEARKLQFLANAAFLSSKGTEKELEGANEALKMYEEALEYWPFDKEVYKSLAAVHTVLGDVEKAESCRSEWAALTLQNAWEHKLRKEERSVA